MGLVCRAGRRRGLTGRFPGRGCLDQSSLEGRPAIDPFPAPAAAAVLPPLGYTSRQIRWLPTSRAASGHLPAARVAEG